jgi:hypothetical protein
MVLQTLPLYDLPQLNIVYSEILPWPNELMAAMMVIF